MTTRRERLKKLVEVQGQLKALHESRRAGFLAAAHAAQTEANELIAHFDQPDSLSNLFPELYHRRIANAGTRQEDNLEKARLEAELIMAATARTNRIERTYQGVRRADERQRGDRERLEMIEQKRDGDK